MSLKMTNDIFRAGQLSKVLSKWRRGKDLESLSLCETASSWMKETTFFTMHDHSLQALSSAGGRGGWKFNETTHLGSIVLEAQYSNIICFQSKEKRNYNSCISINQQKTVPNTLAENIILRKAFWWMYFDQCVATGTHWSKHIHRKKS